MKPPNSDLKHRDSGVSPSSQRLRMLLQWVKELRPLRTLSRFTHVGGAVLAAGMSYQAMFAVFAGIWVGFGILSISIRDNTALLEAITEQINAFVPGLLGPDGVVSLNTLLQTRSIDLTSIIAGASLVWVAMNWFTGTRRAIRIIFGLDVTEYRNAILLKIRDLAGAIFFGILILVSAAMLLISSNFTDWLLVTLGLPEENWLLGTLGGFVRYAAMFAVDLAILIAINRLLAEVEVPWRPLLAGCMLGAFGMLVLKLLAGVVLGGASSNPLLASFAVIVGLLVWFNLICRLLLLTSSWIATGLDRTIHLRGSE